MNEKALRILEFDKIISRLETMAGSAPGKKLCRELKPVSDIQIIRQRQRETSDALARIYRKGSISFSGVADIRPSLRRLEIGSSLNVTELLGICKLLDAARRVKAYGEDDRKEDNEGEDSLAEMFRSLEPASSLNAQIHRCILSEDEIADDASVKLRQIRRSMEQSHEKVRAVLAGMVNGSARTYLQDAVITQRDGRYCLPVKAEYRSAVPGMIHDQSSTGSTLFIEPMAVVKLNNDLRQLELDEAKEIEAILANLSTLAAGSTDDLSRDVQILTQLDFIFARAMLSKSYNGYEPDFNEKGIVNIRRGRHPLLNQKKVVPIDIRVGDDFDLLVISGPNTGGKTVSLKTIGLFTLMGQAGLHIPAAEHSVLSVFDEVFADIGDEQSIEQSLSTFSSHMKNIVSFWEQADQHSLVLFDELGAGTDPTEGAALAIAILSDLHSRGIRTVATTHYSEVKMFALETPGVENGSCEFDVETLSPTYRLLIGVPGKSNAFAISAKLGLPDYIIEDAKSRISKEQENFEDVVAGLEDTRRAAEKELDQAQRSREEASRLQESLEKRQEKLDTSRDKILRDARAQARQILQEAKDYADETIRRYNKLGSEKGSAKAMEQERGKLREKMSSLDKGGSGEKQRRPEKQISADSIRVGDPVRIVSLDLKGTVSTLPDSKGNLFVQCGILRTQTNIRDLEAVDEDVISAPGFKKSSSGKIRASKSYSISPEINLLGKTTDEAITELDKYLDDAYMAHLPSVRIVHGKGTGALRKAVHNYLRRQKHVENFRLGEFGEGDSGVTIVTFK